MPDREEIQRFRDEVKHLTDLIKELVQSERGVGADPNITENIKSLWKEIKFFRRIIFEGNGQESLIIQLEHVKQGLHRLEGDQTDTYRDLTSDIKEINDHLELRRQARLQTKNQEKQHRWTVILAVTTAFLSLLSSLILLIAEFYLKRGSP